VQQRLTLLVALRFQTFAAFVFADFRFAALFQ
jgi:hypothetical protein